MKALVLTLVASVAFGSASRSAHGRTAPASDAPGDAATPAEPNGEPGGDGALGDSGPDEEPELVAPAPVQPLALDTLWLTNGLEVRGRIIQVAEGAYVTVQIDDVRQSLPWAEILRLRIERGSDGEAMELDLSRASLGLTLEPTRDTPYIEIQTRDGRPVSLLRLRRSNDDARQRYSTGYDEVCRAPCARPVKAGSRRFFVDRNPWTASKVFELPDADHVQLRVRPGRVRMRKAGVGLMIGGGAAMIAGIAMLSVPSRPGGPLSNIGVTTTVFSTLAIPLGAILFGVSRAKVTVEVATSPPPSSPAK